MYKAILLVPLLQLSAALAAAHDTWLQTNTNVIRVGDAVHVDLLLGNHGNDHRDFKLAGKPDVKDSSLQIVAPGGKTFDLKDQLVDTGYAPQEGFWTGRFVPSEPGLYVVGHFTDKVVSYAPTRSQKSAKTCFVVSPTLDKVSQDNPGFDRPLGHPLELVPRSNPVTPMGPGTPLRVQLLYKGKPLAQARVSFIPRGQALAEKFDETYERQTDAAGEAAFTPTFGTYYLVVAHHLEPEESGPNHKSTKYSATLCVYVPQVCSCCNE